MATPTAWESMGALNRPIIGSLTNMAQSHSRFFDRTYYQLEYPTGSGNYYVKAGLVLALNTVTYKYVPYVSDASHGTGSDTAVGVLPVDLEVSNWDRICTPIYHGELNERYCYTEAGAEGVISDTIKTALPGIRWI